MSSWQNEPNAKKHGCNRGLGLRLHPRLFRQSRPGSQLGDLPGGSGGDRSPASGGGRLLAQGPPVAWESGLEAEAACCANVRWLFMGGGAQAQRLKRAVRERGHGSVMFRPYQQRERLSDSLSVPDVHLISLKPELEGLIVPSKYYGIAAAGRPVIFVGHPEGELARIIRDSGTGFVIRDGDGAGLAEAVLELARNPELAAGQGARARPLFETRFDFAHAVTAWESLIRKTFGAGMSIG